MGEVHAVTGAFGYSGQYIARRLLDAGVQVRTLTNSPQRPGPFGGRVRAFPLSFDEPDKLVEALRGVCVLHNTYWVRFNHGRAFGFAQAVENTRRLLGAAREAGVRRVVHVSITNPAADSPLGYFRGKAAVEGMLADSGMSYAILRPAVLFGGPGILVNNIAWALRRLPVFGVFGDGRYRLQPIHVDDLAALAVEHAKGEANVTLNAIGPETLTFRALVEAIGEAIGKRRMIVPVPPAVGALASWALGMLVGDVLVTREEIQGLMAELLYVDAPPTGTIRLTEWAREHAGTLGLRYESELARRQRH
jgi:NADH dehydrogenase